MGAVLGLAVVVWDLPDRKLSRGWDGMALLAFSVVGARLDHVVLHGPYFLSHLWEIPQLWLGGLGWVGGVVGGLLGLLAISRVREQPLFPALDIYLPLLGMLAIAVGVASLFGGMGYGPRTSAWWGVPIADELGVYHTRWPIHLLGGVISGGLVLLITLAGPEKGWFARAGRKGSLGLWISMLTFTGVSALRVDPGVFFWGVRLQTWGGVFLTLVASVFILHTTRFFYEH